MLDSAQMLNLVGPTELWVKAKLRGFAHKTGFAHKFNYLPIN
jgi:hypothetical protein